MASKNPELPLLRSYIPPTKQGAKRHYGIHPYFTRRPWNVVQDYIKHYAPQANATVLDPFGGSGVTAIEAAVLGRRGVHVDINPLANFIAAHIAAPSVDLSLLSSSAEDVLTISRKILKEKSAGKILSQFWYPKDIKLPDNADVDWVEELFTERQLAELAVLRDSISRVKNIEIRGLLLLAFSGTLAKTNRTFISAKNRAESRGGSTILSLYRYHVPKKPVELLPIEQFGMRVKKLLLAKTETNELFTASGGQTNIIQGSATDLGSLSSQSVDYIFTDPPYGSYINYLDLSTMWNAWLGLKRSKAMTDNEAIASSSNDEKYFSLIAQSAEECFRVAKSGSYISVVFCHRDLSYWNKIHEIYTSAGFNYKISVAQPLNTVWSVHKKRHDLAALAGEVIITFRKEAKSKAILSDRTLKDIIRDVFADRKRLTTDELCLNLIPALYESGVLRDIGSSKLMLFDFLNEYASYSEKTSMWELPKRRVLSQGTA